jgi:hypothetical protein
MVNDGPHDHRAAQFGNGGEALVHRVASTRCGAGTRPANIARRCSLKRLAVLASAAIASTLAPISSTP